MTNARRRLFVAVLLTTVGLIVVVAIKWKERSQDHQETFHQVDAYQDELLAHCLLADWVWDQRPFTSGPEKQESEPIIIDGLEGKLGKGWYANGQIAYEETWIGGKLHGKQANWNPEGQKTLEQAWKNGFLQGPSIRWYDNGQQAEEAHYDRDRFHGSYKTWYRNGQESLAMSTWMVFEKGRS